ncbi:MAG: PQQ-binding-like beta-propeller repeat protein [Tunicatimonas sp.]
MRRAIVLFWAVLLISSSCERQDELPVRRDAEGALTSMPYQWRTSLSDDGRLIGGTLSPTIQYEDHILFASQGEGENGNRLSMLAIADGKVRWHYDDFFNIQQRFFDIRHQHQYENHFVFQEGKQYYHLDLADGSTIEKRRVDYGSSRMGGLENEYFLATGFLLNEQGTFDGAVFVGDVLTQSRELLIRPEFSGDHLSVNNEVGLVGSVIPHKDASGDIMLTYDYSEPISDYLASTYIGLYNYSKGEHIYRRQPLALNVGSYASGNPIIYEDRLYRVPDKSLVCVDLYTGEKQWAVNFDQGFTFSGFIIAEDKVLANNEDTYLYALDPRTGRQLWRVKSSGTSSPMSYLNGVVYFVGGGDGLLHAVEVATGKHLWRLQSPDMRDNRGAFFKSDVRVVPAEGEGEKGKVLVSSYLSAFCYEAAR